VRGLVVVVSYNQEREIARFLEKLRPYRGPEDVVVVDDGSTDRSPEIAAELGFHVLRSPDNRGVGAAIRRGFEHAREIGRDYVVIMSSNGKMRPEELAAIEEPLLAGRADYVQGNRFKRSGGSVDLSRFRSLAIPAFSAFASAILRRYFSDITCGFRAYTTAFTSDSRMDPRQAWLDRYEMEYYLHFWACRLGYRIEEVPVTIDYSHLEKDRRSKIKPLVGWWSMTRPFVLLGLGLRK